MQKKYKKAALNFLIIDIKIELFLYNNKLQEIQHLQLKIFEFNATNLDILI